MIWLFTACAQFAIIVVAMTYSGITSHRRGRAEGMSEGLRKARSEMSLKIAGMSDLLKSANRITDAISKCWDRDHDRLDRYKALATRLGVAERWIEAGEDANREVVDLSNRITFLITAARNEGWRQGRAEIGLDVEAAEKELGQLYRDIAHFHELAHDHGISTDVEPQGICECLAFKIRDAGAAGRTCGKAEGKYEALNELYDALRDPLDVARRAVSRLPDRPQQTITPIFGTLR